MGGDVGSPTMTGPIVIGLLQNEECFFLFAVVRDETLPVVPVLYARQLSHRGAEIHQYPWGQAAELRNLGEHRKLMPEDAGLVFLGPTLRRSTVQAGLCVSAKFAD